MAQIPVKIGSFAATTAGTVAISPTVSPNAGIGGLGSNLFMEVTAISAGSSLTTSGAQFKWLSPGGSTSVTVASISAVLISSTTNSQFLTVVAAFATTANRVCPIPNQVVVTFQTVGATNGIAADLYLIPAN